VAAAAGDGMRVITVWSAAARAARESFAEELTLPDTTIPAVSSTEWMGRRAGCFPAKHLSFKGKARGDDPGFPIY
jgi:hypothetical protein